MLIVNTAYGISQNAAGASRLAAALRIRHVVPPLASHAYTA